MEFDHFIVAYAFSNLFFERSRLFFRWNDISFETTKKTVAISAKKQKSQKIEFNHYGPGHFTYRLTLC